MSENRPSTLCKNCKHWPKGLWDHPCRACTNEGRSPHPYPGDVMKNHYKRHKDIPIYTQPKTIEDKKREMGLAND